MKIERNIAGMGQRAAAGLALALLALFAVGCGEDASPTVPAPAPAPAPEPEPEPPQQHVTAEQVVDRETLEHFVEDAIELATFSISSESEVYSFFDTTFRPEGPWRSGENYLFLSTLDGHNVFHAALPHLEGMDLSDLEDVNGVRIVEGLLAAAAAGGGFVEYLWDNPDLEGDEVTGSPKVSFAAELTLGGQDYAIGAGFYPPVTAADVRNRGTLMAFVERARTALLAGAGDDLDAAYAFADANFRPEGEWRDGSVYLFFHTMDSISVFHATRPEIEGTDRSAIRDINGVLITAGLRAVASLGGGFFKYHYDDPAVEGDETTGSPKITYAVPMTIGGQDLFLGSGIYVTGDDRSAGRPRRHRPVGRNPRPWCSTERRPKAASARTGRGRVIRTTSSS